MALNATEKLKRLFQDDWEIHGEPKELLLLLREMYLADEQAKKQLSENQVANHGTIREMAGDLRCLVAWVDSVIAGYEPHIDRGSSLFSICEKWRK